MHAYRLVAPNQLAWQEVPEPIPALGEVRVRVLACGVCGTDLHLKSRGREQWRGSALTLGHEIVGQVVEDPNLPTSHPNGDAPLVVIDPQIVCGECYYCRRGRLNLCDRLEHVGLSIDGGFADYLCVPKRNLYTLPPEVTPETCGTYALAEPVATCVAGMNLANPRPDETVAVVGLGFFGQVYLQLARLWGVERTVGVDPLPERRALAERLGATATCPPDDLSPLMELTGGQGASVVIDAAGSPHAAQTCIDSARKAGRIIVFGYRSQPVQVDWYRILSKELTVIGSRSSNHAWEQSLALLHHHRLQLEPLFQFYPREAIAQAFADAESKRVYKPIVWMGQPPSLSGSVASV
ncbi:MAG: alcohol dehydrogenase catalytic domain-containing protein [Fimbriimonadales bacterium]